MQNIDDLVRRATTDRNSDDDWLKLQDDMIQFLKENHPEDEKKKLRPLGWLESVFIICDGIIRRRIAEDDEIQQLKNQIYNLTGEKIEFTYKIHHNNVDYKEYLRNYLKKLNESI